MLRPCVAYGNGPSREQMDELRKGCDVLIATTGLSLTKQMRWSARLGGRYEGGYRRRYIYKMTVWRFQRRRRSCVHDVLCHVPKGGKESLVALPSDYTVNEILTTYSQAPNIQHLHNRLIAGIAALPLCSWISCRRWGFPPHMRLMKSHRCSKKRQDSVQSLPRLIAVESQRDELKQLLRHQNDQIKIRNPRRKKITACVPRCKSMYQIISKHYSSTTRRRLPRIGLSHHCPLNTQSMKS